jgi:trk system potassium uptake protein TrkH
VHKRFVVNTVSRIVLIGSLLMILPLGWALYDDPHSREVFAFIATILSGIFFSWWLPWLFRKISDDYQRVTAKDGLAIVSLSWLAMSFLGAVPLFLSGATGTFTDALFEIVSGFTTTGASIFRDVESLPRGVLFWRSLTQWLGGVGIIVLYLALLPAFGQNFFQLFKAETPGITVERIEPRIKETAQILWIIYLVLSFVETVLLMLGGMPFFDALCHTFGTLSTGGFSTKNASIGAYSPYIQWVITIFMFLAGSNFILHYQAMNGNFKAYWRSEEFRYYAILIFILLFLFAGTLYWENVAGHPLRDAAFQIVSIITATGFCTANFDLWPNPLRFGLLILMFIGGCGGSTSGGMKVVRFFLSLKIAVRSIEQAVYPNAVLPIRFEGSPLSQRIVLDVASYCLIYMLIFFSGAVLFTVTESCDLVTALSASITSLSNVGPGLGRIGPMENFAWVSIPGKWLLTFLMLAGRLELYALLMLFLPTSWRK